MSTDWLHHNSDRFRGRWVALLEDRLVSGEALVVETGFRGLSV